MMSKIFFLTLICFASAKYSWKNEVVEFDCPFSTKQGEKCFRDFSQTPVHVSGADLVINLRPDIDPRNVTKSETESERQCCYEYSCLVKCGLEYDLYANPKSRQLPESAFAAFDEYPRFFKAMNLTEQRNNLYELFDKAESVRGRWEIIMFHFYLAEQKWRNAKETVRELEEIFL